jgi:hypothetical protein
MSVNPFVRPSVRPARTHHAHHIHVTCHILTTQAWNPTTILPIKLCRSAPAHHRRHHCPGWPNGSGPDSGPYDSPICSISRRRPYHRRLLRVFHPLRGSVLVGLLLSICLIGHLCRHGSGTPLLITGCSHLSRTVDGSIGPDVRVCVDLQRH